MLVLAHLNKDASQKPGSRVAGSADFRNAARSLLLAGRDDEDRERGRLLIHDKMNGGVEGPDLGFDIADHGGAVWRTNDLTRADCFGGKKSGPSQQDRVSNIISAVLQMVPEHRAPSEDVKRIIEAAFPGLNDQVIRRGRERAHIIDHKHASGRTDWELPPLLARSAN